jgi:hypothetical protein
MSAQLSHSLGPLPNQDESRHRAVRRSPKLSLRFVIDREPGALRVRFGELYAGSYIWTQRLLGENSWEATSDAPVICRETLRTAVISVWFAVAMVVGGVSAPLLGRSLDRFGAPIVALAVPATAAAVPLVFLGQGYIAAAGAALWGIGTAVQDALLLALVSTVLTEGRKATALGLYDTIFGIAWFMGSAAFGFLADKSIPTLVFFSVVLQLLAIPFFSIRSGRGPSRITP